MVQVSIVAPSKAQADAYVIGVDKDRKAPGLGLLGLADTAAVQAVLDTKDIPIPFRGTKTLRTTDGWMVLVGVGDPSKLTQEKVGTLANIGAKAAAGLAAKSATTTLVGDCGLELRDAVQAATQGAIIGSLAFDQYKSKEEKEKAEEKEPDEEKLRFQLVVDGRQVAGARTTCEKAAIVAEAVNDARLLANTPANICTPKWLAEEARKRGRKHGFKVSVKGRETLRKEGYNAICAVGQGSDNEEQLIIMDYNPPKAKKTLVLVGKGVCFDSGGISLKPGQGMWDMKYDKCGACNTIALMATLKALGVKHRVIGITPAVENMPGGRAQRPGDIITAKDGTTIEVLNTDAEGRLILADAITHARTFEPHWIIEQSTLTGACEFAVGKTFVAAMSKQDSFVDSIIDAARRAGDKAWKLPQGEEFDDGNKGTYADIQNISLKVKAGTSIGGAFVGHFAKDTTFCHLDIAAKAWVDGQDYFPKGPTGAGLRIALQRVLDEA